MDDTRKARNDKIRALQKHLREAMKMLDDLLDDDWVDTANELIADVAREASAATSDVAPDTASEVTLVNPGLEAKKQIAVNNVTRVRQLHTKLPSLKAIYLVNPRTMHSRMTSRADLDRLYDTRAFLVHGNAPVELFGGYREVYLQVCGDCTISRSDGGGWCEKHVGAGVGRCWHGVEVCLCQEEKLVEDLANLCFDATYGGIAGCWNARGVKVWDMTEGEKVFKKWSSEEVAGEKLINPCSHVWSQVELAKTPGACRHMRGHGK